MNTSDVVVEAMRQLIRQLKVDVRPAPSRTESIRSVLGRAPADSTAHRIASAACRCGKCGSMLQLKDAHMLLPNPGETKPFIVGCPHCDGEDTIILMEDLRGGSRA